MSNSDTTGTTPVDNATFVDDIGLTIGLVNYMGKKPLKDFCEEEFKLRLFKPYKDGIKTGDKKLAEYLFAPKFYNMFGDNNVMLLTLVDDFTFVNRSLHPAHIIDDSANDANDSDFVGDYTIQVFNGVNLWNGQQEGEKLSVLAAETFLREDPTPFVGLICYKINNALLIGNGLRVTNAIKHNLQEISQEGNIKIICLNSFSNFEITVLAFSDSIWDICAFVEKSRKLRLENLENKSQIERSLLCSKEQNGKYKDPDDAHIFSSTITRLGYNKEALNELSERVLHDFQLDFVLRTGHAHVFREEFNKVLKLNKINRNQVEYTIVPGQHTSRVVLRNIPIALFGDSFEEEVKERVGPHIRSIRIKININSPNNDDDGWKYEDKHPNSMAVLRNLKISKKEIIEIDSVLDGIGVSKVLKERLLKMIGTFNSCVCDVTYFPYFVEIKGYLQSIISKLKNFVDSENKEELTNKEIHEWINNQITNYEHAYFNRFHHSTKSLLISDTNLEYNGGIQQLISAFDFAYKAIIGKITSPKVGIGDGENRILYVSGYENVNSVLSSMRVDITHLTSPELLATIIWKESLNFYFDSLIIDQNANSEGKLDEVAQNIIQLADLVRPCGNFDQFKELVHYHKGLDYDKQAHRVLDKAFSVKFMQYLVLDYYVLMNGFMADFRLFTNFYWQYFMQMTHYYTSPRDGRMDEKSVIYFMTRWLFVKKLLDLDENSISNAYDENIPYDSILSDVWIRNINDVSTFVDIIIDLLESNDILESIISSGAIFTDAFEVEEDLSVFKLVLDSLIEGRVWEIDLDKFMSMECTSNKNAPNEETPNIGASYYVNNLNNGLLCCIDSINNHSSSPTISINANELMNYVVKNEAKVRVRNQSNEITLKKSQPLQSDPYGGIFISDVDTRGSYFKVRMAYIMSLWDLAQKNKLKTIKGYLKNKD